MFYYFLKLTSTMKNYLTIIILSAAYHIHAQIISSKEILIAPSVFIEVVEHNCEMENHSLKLIIKGIDNYSSIQWQASKDNITWENIGQQNNFNYELLIVKEKEKYYRAICTPITSKELLTVSTISNILILTCKPNYSSKK